MCECWQLRASAHSGLATSLSLPSSFSSASSPRPRSRSAEGRGKWQPPRRRVSCLSALPGPGLLPVWSGTIPGRCPRSPAGPEALSRRRARSRRGEGRGLRRGLLLAPASGPGPAGRGGAGGQPALLRGCPGLLAPGETAVLPGGTEQPPAAAPAAAVCPVCRPHFTHMASRHLVWPVCPRSPPSKGRAGGRRFGRGAVVQTQRERTELLLLPHPCLRAVWPQLCNNLLPYPQHPWAWRVRWSWALPRAPPGAWLGWEKTHVHSSPGFLFNGPSHHYRVGLSVDLLHFA